MALLEIIHYPSKILRTISKEVVSFDSKLHQQLDDMYETMIASEGIGLAAIQVGLPLRMLIINLPREDGVQHKEDCLEIINPKFIETGGSMMYREGCLSVPGFYEEVERFEKVKIEYQNRFAEVKILEASELLAVAIQHEIDHLNGVLFVDKLSILKRKKFEKELKELQKTKTQVTTMINTIFCTTMQRGVAEIVAVEATFTRALPAFVISGLANSSIQEAKQRVQSALQNNDFTFPPLKITINLSPSDLPKSGSHFDLPIALLIALQKQELAFKEWFAFGELGLDGKIKSNPNIFPMLLDIAIKRPHAKVIAPKANEELFSLIPNLQCFFVEHFKEALEILQNPEIKADTHTKKLPFKTIELNDKEYYFSDAYALDFKEVKGQAVAKEAALIASAGFHNLILEGSPGCGKSMIINRMRYILPPLSLNEILEATKLRILSEQDSAYYPLRSFRNPHQSASKSSILGSSSLREPKPGEIALAHNGMLFFDELPHFKKDILEALREPLENNKLVISRVHSKIEYDTSFLFVGAQNPCLCGNLLSTTKACRCQDREITQYKNRLSEPFLDRIDLFVQMEEGNYKDTPSHSWTSKEMHELVLLAFKQQKLRKQSAFNGKLNEEQIERFCPLNFEAQKLLEQAVERFNLSMRSVNKVKKVARTIADLNACEDIEKSHMLKALSFRKIS